MYSPERKAFLDDYNVKSETELLPLWARNAVENAGAVRAGRDAAELRAKGLNVPAILIASGPSLNQNIALLKDCRDKALLVACDSAYIPLLDAGCVPHIVVSIDPKQKNSRFFDGTLSYQKHTKFVCASVVHNDVVRSWRYPPYFFHPDANSSFFRALPALTADKEFIAAGGNVLSVATVLAMFLLMCDPIVLVGADYCWYDSAHHVKGANVTPFRDQVERTHDCHGKAVSWGYALRVYHTWATELLEGGIVRQADGRDLTVFNCTEGGMLSCAGVYNRPLGYVMKKFLNLSYGDLQDRLERGA